MPPSRGSMHGFMQGCRSALDQLGTVHNPVQIPTWVCQQQPLLCMCSHVACMSGAVATAIICSAVFSSTLPLACMYWQLRMWAVASAQWCVRAAPGEPYSHKPGQMRAAF